MKVLRVIASMDPKSGGPCQGIRNTIPEMNRHGVETEVVCLDSPEASYRGKDSFQIHFMGPVSNPWAYSKKLAKWLEENISRFDIILAHGLWLYPTYALAKAMKNYRSSGTVIQENRPKWFIMPHGMLDPYFQNAPDRKLKSIRNKVYWKLIESKVIESADGLLFTCEQELLLARETFKKYSPKLEVNVGYGINPPPQPTPKMETAFAEKCRVEEGYLLFLSRIHPKKGVDLLIKAYQKVLNDLGHVPDLVIAGPGMESDYGKGLTDLADQLGVKSKVHFPGMLIDDEKWGAFHGADAFVLTSYQENFGIAVAEALACEKAVIISDQVNIWREIESGNGGFVSSTEVAEIESNLKKWVTLSEQEKTRMKQSAAQVYRENFRVEAHVENLISLFSNQLKGTDRIA